jgi:hypothetical protein
MYQGVAAGTVPSLRTDSKLCCCVPCASRAASQSSVLSGLVLWVLHGGHVVCCLLLDHLAQHQRVVLRLLRNGTQEVAQLQTQAGRQAGGTVSKAS